MIDYSIDGIVQVLGIVGVAIILSLIGIQKILKEWKSTNVETSIIDIMHTELERMSEQNTSLSNEIGRLHSEIIQLNQQLQVLSLENRRLQEEVVALIAEVNIFKASVISNTRREDINGTLKIN